MKKECGILTGEAIFFLRPSTAENKLWKGCVGVTLGGGGSLLQASSLWDCWDWIMTVNVAGKKGPIPSFILTALAWLWTNSKPASVSGPATYSLCSLSCFSLPSTGTLWLLSPPSQHRALWLPLASFLAPRRTLGAGLYGDWWTPDQWGPGFCVFLLHHSPRLILPGQCTPCHAINW